jgi:hypothetical protein
VEEKVPATSIVSGATAFVEEIRLMVSGGTSTGQQRDDAGIAFEQLRHVIRLEMFLPYDVIHWNYLKDTPITLVGSSLEERSLEMVDWCQGIVAVLSQDVPELTGKEIEKVIQLKVAGHSKELWVFVDSDHPRDDIKSFLKRLDDTYGSSVRYRKYSGDIEFVTSLMATLFPYLVDRIRPRLMTAGR